MEDTDVSESTTRTRSDRIRLLDEALSERILVIDGAMGTMIQRHAPTEEDFRGDLFGDASESLLGANDLLSMTRPDMIGEIHTQYMAAGADLVKDDRRLEGEGGEDLARRVRLGDAVVRVDFDHIAHVHLGHVHLERQRALS